MASLSISQHIWSIIALTLIFSSIITVITIFDLTSYLPTGHETLLPINNAIGAALIVYNLDVNGMGTGSAKWVGSDLRIRGYETTVAGIRSDGIENATDKDIMIVIGPTYFGGPTSSVTAYLQTLQTKPDAKVGIYTISGMFGDDASLHMRNILENRSVEVKSNSSISAWDKDAEERSYAFIFSILE